MAVEVPTNHLSVVIGVDDFAFRKGCTYGTIIVDLKRRCVIDLLPDRRKETLQKWLKQHPKIQVVSRDRARAYAKAVSSGALQALQVADRWHLMKNLGEAVERFLNGKTNLIRQAHNRSLEDDKEQIPNQKGLAPNPIGKTEVSLKTISVSEQKRKEKCDRVRTLIGKGIGLRAIARQLGLSRKSVRKYVYGDAPHRFGKRTSSSEIDPFRPFLCQRWDHGINNAAQLCRELREKGFKGSQSNLRQYVASWGKPKSRSTNSSEAPSPIKLIHPCPSPWRVSRLMTLNESKTTKTETAFLHHLYKLCSPAITAATLGRQFLALLREKRKDLFNQWLKQDREAVEAAMCSNWSNGQTEGQVNRLKLVKRQMFGRASFELLKKRILLTTKH